MDFDYEVAMEVAKELDRLEAIKGPNFDLLGKRMMLIGGGMMIASIVIGIYGPAIHDAVTSKIQKIRNKKK